MTSPHQPPVDTLLAEVSTEPENKQPELKSLFPVAHHQSHTTATVESIKRLLINVLQKVTELPENRVILENEAGPRPTCGVYCSLAWKSYDPLPENDGDFLFVPFPPHKNIHDDTYDKTTSITQCLRHEAHCTARISFWGDSAMEMAVKTVRGMQANERWFDLWRIIGFGGVDTIHGSGRASHGKNQSSCHFDLSFYACFGEEYPADWFDAAPFELSLIEQTDEIIFSKENYDDIDPRCMP